MSVQTCMADFLLWNMKVDVLRSFETLELNGHQKCLVSNILQNIFCVPQNKENLICLEQCEGQ